MNSSFYNVESITQQIEVSRNEYNYKIGFLEGVKSVLKNLQMKLDLSSYNEVCNKLNNNDNNTESL